MWLIDQPGRRCFKSLWSATLFFLSINIHSRIFFKNSSGLQEQVQSFWAHCVMVERKKAETWTSCHPGRGTGCCTVRPNYKNPPEIKLKKSGKLSDHTHICNNLKKPETEILKVTLKNSWNHIETEVNVFLAGLCHMEPQCAGTARTKWSRFEPRSHALEKFSCCVLEGPNRQTDSWLVFQKKIQFVLLLNSVIYPVNWR